VSYSPTVFCHVSSPQYKQHITSKFIFTILTTLQNAQSSILLRIFSLIHVRLKSELLWKDGHICIYSQQLSKYRPSNVLFTLISTTSMEGYILKQMLSCINSYGYLYVIKTQLPSEFTTIVPTTPLCDCILFIVSSTSLA
jgi:hypothetical protein